MATGLLLKRKDPSAATLKRMNGFSSTEAIGSEPEFARDPFEVPEAVLESRRRPMAERLELALSWNLLASELAVGLNELKEASASSK